MKNKTACSRHGYDGCPVCFGQYLHAISDSEIVPVFWIGDTPNTPPTEEEVNEIFSMLGA